MFYWLYWLLALPAVLIVWVIVRALGRRPGTVLRLGTLLYVGVGLAPSLAVLPARMALIQLVMSGAASVNIRAVGEVWSPSFDRASVELSSHTGVGYYSDHPYLAGSDKNSRFLEVEFHGSQCWVREGARREAPSPLDQAAIEEFIRKVDFEDPYSKLPGLDTSPGRGQVAREILAALQSVQEGREPRVERSALLRVAGFKSSWELSDGRWLCSTVLLFLLLLAAGYRWLTSPPAS